MFGFYVESSIFLHYAIFEILTLTKIDPPYCDSLLTVLSVQSFRVLSVPIYIDAGSRLCPGHRPRHFNTRYDSSYTRQLVTVTKPS